MINPNSVYVSEAATEALQSAASELQQLYIVNSSTVYRAEDLERALVSWLEAAIESLSEDALDHVLKQGTAAGAFQRALSKLQPVEPATVAAA